MAERTITPDALREEEVATAGLLGKLHAGAGGGRGLKLPWTELLTYLAEKVVLPVASGFVSRALYDKFKSWRTKADAAQARAAIEGQPVTVPPQVDRETVIREVSAELAGEGISPSEAERVVAAC